MASESSGDAIVSPQRLSTIRDVHSIAQDENSYFPAPYYEGGQWHLPASPEVSEGLKNFFGNPDQYPVDDRGVAYTVGFFSTKHLGKGQFYPQTSTTA